MRINGKYVLQVEVMGLTGRLTCGEERKGTIIGFQLKQLNVY